MYNTKVKKALWFLSIIIVTATACDLSVAVSPSTNPSPLPTNTVIPVTVAPTQILASPTTSPPTIPPIATATTSQAAFEGEEVSVYPLTIHVSPELAGGMYGTQFPRLDGADAAWWQKTPGHTQITLEAYILQGKLHQPQIFVYPALDYAQLVPVAFESMHRLNNILAGQPFDRNGLPAVPFLNAQQAFASQDQVLSFQNGRGMRFLTEYAQYPVSANNTDLFYEYQGFTSDGAYYVVAILPITAPVLAETSDPGAPLLPGGIPYPYFAEGIEADMPGYYSAVTNLLDSTSPEAFRPTIRQLDLLIQSMQITP
jgi:hypothetical protein